jgi:uncharacterized cupredoxin-like copper-binding protein
MVTQMHGGERCVSLRVGGLTTLVLAVLTACSGADGPLASNAPSLGEESDEPSATATLPEGVIAVSLSEMDLLLSGATAPAGAVTFQIRNAGELPHELVVIRTDKDATQLPVEEVKVVERRLEIVARSEHLAAGQESTLNVDLAPGHYVLICNLSGHYEQSQFGPGMRANFDVG